MGRPLAVPVLIARGREPGPTVGLLAAVHGNELNGAPVIHQLFRALDRRTLRGAVVGVPIVNVMAFVNRSRTLREGQDLNRMMPGRERGAVAEQFAFHLRTRIVESLDYLIDLHTAGAGRVNSLYVRAALQHPIARQMALWSGAEIVVHAPRHEGTVRGAAMAAGIPSITVEVGDPQRFQPRLIQSTTAGIANIMSGLGMLPREALSPKPPAICVGSRWLFAEHGGLLEVFPPLAARVASKAVVARVSNVFGDVVAEYASPKAGIVVGKTIDPACESGTRIVHLGILGELGDIPTED